MNKGPSFRKNSISSNIIPLLPIYLVIIVTILIKSFFFDHGHISYDSSCYLRLAQNLLDNNSFFLNSLYVPSGKEFFAIWPIGYPYMIYLVAEITNLSVFLSSKILNILFLSGIFLIFINKFKADAYLFGFILLLAPAIEIFSFTWSEVPFIFGLLWFTLALITATDKKENFFTFLNLSLSSIFLFLSRYIGAYSIILILLFGIYHLFSKDYRKLLYFLVSGCIAGLFVTLYLYNNQIHTGHITGIPRSPSSESALAMVKMITTAYLSEFVNFFTFSLLFRDNQHITPHIVALAASLAIILFAIKLKIFPIKLEKTPHNSAILIFFIAGISYIITITTLRILTVFDPLSYRLLFPGTFLLLISLILFFKNFSTDKQTVNTFKFIFGTFAIIGFTSNFINSTPRIPVASIIENGYNQTVPYFVHRERLIEKSKAIKPESIVILPDAGLNYLRPDIVSVYPHPETETWDQFIERIKSLNTHKRATYIYFQKDFPYGYYHPSIVDLIRSHNKVEIVRMQ